MATVPIFYCSLFLTRQQSQHISFLKKTVYLVKQKVFSASERKERDRENKKGVRAVKSDGEGELEVVGKEEKEKRESKSLQRSRR